MYEKGPEDLAVASFQSLLSTSGFYPSTTSLTQTGGDTR